MKSQHHHCSKEEEIESLKRKIDEIHSAVVGGYNGADGLRSDVRMLNANMKNHNERLGLVEGVVGTLNNKMAWYGGAIAVVVFVITWFSRFWK